MSIVCTVAFWVGRNSTYRLRYWNSISALSAGTHLMICRNSTYRLRYWNMLKASDKKVRISNKSQQYLPFTVLKLHQDVVLLTLYLVATVLTVYGIETTNSFHKNFSCNHVATVLTVYGIETTAIVNTANFFISRNSTYRLRYWNFAIYINLDWWYVSVATVLTVYGIETSRIRSLFYISNWRVATVLTVYGIETKQKVSLDILMN